MMGLDVVLLIIVLVAGLYMLWNIGANDVANAIGTSVGSKALSLKHAVILAAILEFSGAFVLGSNVSETIQNGIIPASVFQNDPMIFVLGMISALLATALWLQIATFFRWPVSTTHAILGAILGFGVMIGGFTAVKWDTVGSIALSWIISPTLSGLIAYIFFTYIQRYILFSRAPVQSTVRGAPILLGIVTLTFAISLGANGIKNLDLHISFGMVLIFSIAISIAIALLTKWLLVRFPIQKGLSIRTASIYSQQLHSLYKANKHLSRFKTVGTSDHNEEVNVMIDNINVITKEIKSRAREKSTISSEYHVVEKIFAYLQIVTACCVAFAHGANDVANAIGPVAGVIQIVRHPEMLNQAAVIPLWLLALGGLGIILGLATYGWRVIETIGKKITLLTPTRGFCAEFGAATSILIASKLGFPISTTQCIVGAVLGVGLARGITALNVRVLRDIFLSWIITLPCSAITSVLVFYLLKTIFHGYHLV